MHYISTRGNDGPLGFEDALLSGLARDGGLYLPTEWPRFSMDEIREAQAASNFARRFTTTHWFEFLLFQPLNLFSLEHFLTPKAVF